MFRVHTPDTAHDASKPTLHEARENYGMIPNLYGVLAEEPAAVQAYAALNDALTDSGLSPAEQQVAILATSIENGCTYCVAAHSTIVKMQELFDEATLEALRAQESLPDERLEALRAFTVEVVRERGWVAQGALQAFLDTGYEPRHVLAVVTVVAMKTLSNYTNHIADTPLDEAFAGQRWSKAAVPA
ncbi:MAG: carboxymuconolactone decarboxylase family protein [Gemmatimonadota bacterium]